MTNTETRSPFRGRGFIAAAIVVGVVVLAAIVVLVTSLMGGGDEPDAKPTGTPTATPTSSAADKSVCGLEGFETTSSLNAAPENDWELVGTVAAPTEPDGAGPGVTEENGFRSCYAHTAEGALFAAVSYVAVNSDSRNTARLYELLAAGPVRDQLQSITQPGEASATRLQVAGFKINSYTSDEAVVDVAWQVTSEGGSLVSMPTVVKWEDGDWKISIGEDGPTFAASRRIRPLGWGLVHGRHGGLQQSDLFCDAYG
jgi:hypothetical protein